MGIPIGWVSNPLFIFAWLAVLFDEWRVVDVDIVRLSVVSLLLLAGLMYLTVKGM